MKQFLSPRQAAQSMGVSESSLKRWCDRGILQTLRTTGGHRRIPVSSVVEFLRDNNREFVKPELVGLPSRLRETTEALSTAIEPLTQALTNGDGETCHRLVFSFFMSGRRIAEISDELLTPSLALLGERWSNGEVEIFEEHRAVEMVVRLLHELRSAIGPASKEAPIAMGGTVEGDCYALPTQLIELALIESGWRATSLGTSLPFEALLGAIRKNTPSLFWLGLSTVAVETAFVSELNEFCKAASNVTSVFVGGRAVTPDVRSRLLYATPCTNIQHLVAVAGSKRSVATKPKG